MILMYKKLLTVETARMLGNGALRVGADIVYEGTKMVIFKTARGVAINTVDNRGVKGLKDMTLDDVLGDITRKEIRAERKMNRQIKKELKNKKKEELKERLMKEFEKESLKKESKE